MPDAQSPGPEPNFSCNHSVILSVPIKDVYRVLGTPEGHERVCKLSEMCKKVELYEKDQVVLPDAHTKFSDGGRLRVLKPAENETGGSGKRITRQHFLMEEGVPIIPVLYTHTVRLNGTLSYDEAALETLSSLSPESPFPSGPVEALYETVSGEGIIVWKLRVFEVDKEDTNKTKVSERIEGWAPKLFRAITESQATKGHKAHMDLYHTLF